MNLRSLPDDETKAVYVSEVSMFLFLFYMHLSTLTVALLLLVIVSPDESSHFPRFGFIIYFYLKN